jgi:murein L,D-transpeptidase YafK
LSRKIAASRASRLAIVAALGVIVGACEERRGGQLGSYRAYAPISTETLQQMAEAGTDKHKPVLIRTFKKEAELEIWKMRADGEYVLFKTYPMCRWSGQLGPKKREGDRQVPEGFYTITPAQLNPNSNYYLSINVGYPNSYDRANGYTGSLIMVHGDCSSAGCFSMTDEQIAEIYAIAREAFGGGQRAIQLQSLPFRMSADNLAKHRFDPHMRFWKQLKEGVDQFEVTRRETAVAVCGKHYVFGASPATPDARFDSTEACPPLVQDPELKTRVAEKQQQDDVKVASLVSQGVKAVKVVYADGGQHPAFNHVQVTSRPEALAEPPREIAINEKGAPIPANAVASAKPRPASPTTVATISKPAPPVTQTTIARTQPAGAPAAAAFAPVAPQPAAEAPVEPQPLYKRLLGIGPKESEPAAAEAPPAKPQASLGTAKPKIVSKAKPVLPAGVNAYAPLER